MNNKDVIRKAAETYSSFYLYDEKNILRHINTLKTRFPSAEFLYSVKCNPHAHILNTVFSQGLGADAASYAEVEYALERGVGKDMIFYSAPGKSRKDISRALTTATLIADSLSEITRIREAAEAQACPTEIGIRINPEFTFDGPGGVPSKFGIDEADALDYLLNAKDDPFLKVTGIHVHAKSQELSAATIHRYYENVFALAGRVEAALGRPLEYINFGSGIGIPYSPKEDWVDLEWLGAQMEASIAAYRQNHPDTRLLIEVGRFVVGKSGVYASRVLDRKVSHGKTFILLHNTLTGFYRPSVARMIARYTDQEDAVPTEPMFTGFDAFEISAITDCTEQESITLMGNLCTAADIVADGITLPKLNEGDVVVFTNAGSYAAVLTPMQFSSQEMPAQLFLTADGELKK